MSSIAGKVGCWADDENLPYDAEVEWLENNRACWIDTGLSNAPKYDVIIDCKANANIDSGVVLGAWNGAPARAYYLRLTGVSEVCISYGDYGADYVAMQGFSIRDRHLYHTYFANGMMVVECDGVFVRSINGSGIIEEEKNLYLLSNNSWDPNNSAEYFNGKFYACKISSDGSHEVLRDFIPVRFTNENGVSEGAIYDRVSGRLFRNAGTGAFIIGPDKAQFNLT